MNTSNININDKFKILNEVIEDIPDDYIRQIKLNFDAKIISIILLEKLNKNINEKYKLIFNELHYDNYKMQDIYYLIAKISNNILENNYKINYFPNYKKNGFNIFINNSYTFDLYQDFDDVIIIEKF